ncbi:MAG: peptidoglycan-binding protein [Pseudomonadota bacterium]
MQRQKGKPRGQVNENTQWADDFWRYLSDNGVSLAGGTFAAGLGVAVIANTLFLQEGSHPAPLWQSRSSQGTDLTLTTASVPEPRPRAVGENGPNLLVADPLVHDIQEELAIRGYYNAEVDGLIGQRTRRAIELYQQAFAQSVDPTPSRALLQHIRLSSTDPAFHERIRERLAEASVDTLRQERVTQVVIANTAVLEDAETIKRVQRALRGYGFPDLAVDGMIGTQTREAIRTFERSRGLQESGSITTVLLAELSKLRDL